jgi:hypothetical protein
VPLEVVLLFVQWSCRWSVQKLKPFPYFLSSSIGSWIIANAVPRSPAIIATVAINIYFPFSSWGSPWTTRKTIDPFPDIWKRHAQRKTPYLAVEGLSNLITREL